MSSYTEFDMYSSVIEDGGLPQRNAAGDFSLTNLRRLTSTWRGCSYADSNAKQIPTLNTSLVL